MNETINQEIAQREGAQKAFQDHYAFLAAGAIDKLIECGMSTGFVSFRSHHLAFPRGWRVD